MIVICMAWLGVLVDFIKIKRRALSYMHYHGIMSIAGHQMLQFDWSMCVTWAGMIRGSGIILHSGLFMNMCLMCSHYQWE